MGGSRVRRWVKHFKVSSDGWNRVLPQGNFKNIQNAGRNVYKEVLTMWKNKESYVDKGGIFGLSIKEHVTLQTIVAHDFRYDPRIYTILM